MKFLRGLALFVGLVAMLSAAEFKVGDAIEALSYGTWSKGKVIEVGEGKWKVTYDGYSASWDEWVGPDKIRAVGAVVAASVPKATGPAVRGQWRAGDRVEGLSYGSWYPATVLEAGEGKWKVHYDGYGSGSDEWLEAEKIRPLRTAAWKVGDRVEALSYGKWYGARIIEAEPARWKVTYDGYSSSSDEWVNVDRIRAPGAKTEGGSDKTGKAVETYAFPARPAGAKAGIEGAFLRVETFYSGSSLSLSNQGWFFTKDGRFSKAPRGGFDLKEFATTTEPRKTDGSYWIADGKITFAWASGSKPTVYDFKVEGDDLKWSGLGSVRVEGFKKSWRFDGEYSGGASIGGGALASSNTIVFRADGTYSRESVASFKAASDRSVVSGGSTGAAAGTYAFDGFTLSLTATDGTVQAFTVFAFGHNDAAGRPEYIYRDGQMMKRR